MSPLRAVIANITAHTEPCLAELADHAFALIYKQTGCNLNNVPSGICTKNRKARILYSVKDKAGPPLPIKVILYQDSVPAVEIRLPMETGQVERAREEIEPYLQESLKRLERICDSPGSLEAHCSAWQDFLKRLESNGISSAQSQVCTDSPFFEKPCPSCEVLTTLCTSCYAVICLSGDCPASRLIPFQSCSRHTYAAACLSCLQNVQTVPPLGQCPECNLWFCDRELAWGRADPKRLRTRLQATPHVGYQAVFKSTLPSLSCVLTAIGIQPCQNAPMQVVGQEKEISNFQESANHAPLWVGSRARANAIGSVITAKSLQWQIVSSSARDASGRTASAGASTSDSAPSAVGQRYATTVWKKIGVHLRGWTVQR